MALRKFGCLPHGQAMRCRHLLTVKGKGTFFTCPEASGPVHASIK